MKERPMNPSKLTQVHEPELLSRIGGTIHGGSAKTKAERERLDRKHDVEPQPNPEAKRELPDADPDADPRRPEAQPPADRRK